VIAVAAAALLGVANALHCAGMCGPFAVLTAGAAPWQAGRVISYTMLGAAVGSLGGVALGAAGHAAGIAGTVVSVIALVAASAWLAGFGVHSSLGARVGRWLGRPLRAAAEAKGARRVLRQGLFGLANGLVPCGAVYAALGLAASAGGLQAGALGGAAAGAGTMAAFGLSTVPGLWLLGRSGGSVRRIGLPARRAVAALMLVLGLAVLAGRAPTAEVDAAPDCHVE